MTQGNEVAEETKAGLNFMNAIEAHVRWKIRLEAYINKTGDEALDAAVVGADDQCVLGKWLHGDGDVKFGDHPLFPDLKVTHANFHRCAGEIISTVDAGDPEAARKLLMQGDYARYSHRIKSELARMSLELESD